MIEEIGTALVTLRKAMSAASGMMKLKTDVAVQQKAIELQGLILALQEQLQAVQTAQTEEARKYSELEAETHKMRDWSKEKTRYHLHRFDEGGMAYRHQPRAGDASPTHDLCAQCYDDGVKSILQVSAPVKWFSALKCHRCGSTVLTGRLPSAGITISPPRRNRWFDV